MLSFYFLRKKQKFITGKKNSRLFILENGKNRTQDNANVIFYMKKDDLDESQFNMQTTSSGTFRYIP